MTGTIAAAPQHAEYHFSQLTTLGVGGPIRTLLEPGDELEVVSLLRVLDAAQDLLVLGSGSNLVASDEEHRSPVLSLRRLAGVVWEQPHDEYVTVIADAGVAWDALVSDSCMRGLYGMELLSGIPGTVGAAPVQNIAAYGQNVSDVIISVRALDLKSGAVVELDAKECDFSYRNSRFKSNQGTAHIILSVRFRLFRRPTTASLDYFDLKGAFGNADPIAVSSDRRRAAVLKIRAEKNLLFEGSTSPRTAGSFFTSPFVEEELARAIIGQVVGAERCDEFMFRYGSDKGGAFKVPASHVLLATGFRNGDTWGRVGLLREQVLAIQNLGGASCAEVLALAGIIQSRVRDQWGIDLGVEPQLIGTAVDEHRGLAPRLAASFRQAADYTPIWVKSH